MAAPTFAGHKTSYMLTESGEWNENSGLEEEYFAWQSSQVQRKRHLAAGCTSMPGQKFYIDQDNNDDNSSISDAPDEDSADEDSFDPLLTPTVSSSLPTIAKQADSCISVLPMAEFSIARIPSDKAMSSKSHLRRCDTRCYSGLDKWFTSNSHA